MQNSMSAQSDLPAAKEQDLRNIFSVEYTTLRPTPYVCLDEERRETLSGGVLDAVTLVRTQRPLADLQSYMRIDALVDRVGIISITPGLLRSKK
jgi:hypothetical protein